ncbi:shikimate 5-dehydrogenase [Vibrio viridaestus]|uniref:Shikimate 5-dehydrogenase n=1 Tax=Vibrio viridaestus TaxID=2487322 RepID=A0A3N9TCN6_9VIBR|nr:shikimate 5-dehydrogenase [Vibrio viridaestus]RQW61829.1 shikimate 5-dehydrogenase [Vibrio viridaestus]
MELPINKETTLCISLAGNPSNFGTRFHNFLYKELGLNFIYKAFTTDDIESAVKGIRALGIRGCGVSMPFKEACIPYVDEITESAKAIDSINTIVNDNGYLKAYNTDYIAIYQLLKRNEISPDTTFALKGSGGMAKAVACALRDLGFKKGFIVARNDKKGKALAEVSGFEWCSELCDTDIQMLINATPVGMKDTKLAEQLSFSEEQIMSAEIIFDVVAKPSHTPLIKKAIELEKINIRGSDVFAIQALEQFKLYTGVKPDKDQFAKASVYSRSE